jgi:GTP-binding protein EngB required for normal cell division
MHSLSKRALTSQLADDLGWLEQHARRGATHAATAGLLRLASAVVRNCVGPFLDGQPPTPLHVVVVGGAGAGKSTVANMLSGSLQAEANAQAGFTRHPIAYTSATGPIEWAAHLGFLGPLTRLTQPGPSSIDQDVYQVRRVQAEPGGIDLLREWIVWDCPDMTTWAAEAYIPRLLEAAGLADVIVYVASDERYNDEVPTQFLQLLLRAGKPVVVCLTKMDEANAGAMVEHFRKEVLGGLPDGLARGVVAVLPIPYLSAKQLADPVREAGKVRVPLLNQVAVLGSPPATARRRTVLGACRLLTQRQSALFAVARDDLQALEAWQDLVKSGQVEFDARYFREYLMTEKYRGFDDALVKLIELLDLPGVGQIISGTLYVLRTPYRLLRGVLSKAMTRPEAPTRPEQPILEESLAAWVDHLRKEAAHRAAGHPLWQHLHAGFQSGTIGERTQAQFASVYRAYQAALAAEVTRTARAIYERLQKQPVLLNSLRVSKLAIEAAAIGGTLATGGIGWHDVILVPLVASLTHQLVEVLGRQVVDAERETTRARQQQILHDSLSTPLAEFLSQWPTTGGSPFERLQLALRRLPAAIQELEARVRDVVGPPGGPGRQTP